MKVINSSKEYKDFYPYKSPPEECPSEYPCICEIIEGGGGIGGEWMEVKITYIPKDVDRESWIKGFFANSK